MSLYNQLVFFVKILVTVDILLTKTEPNIKRECNINNPNMTQYFKVIIIQAERNKKM